MSILTPTVKICEDKVLRSYEHFFQTEAQEVRLRNSTVATSLNSLYCTGTELNYETKNSTGTSLNSLYWD
jgi:hypothetical protein